ncbi:hypothetical protein, conserved [Eimeria tenella]|uniref:Uncharacterized protein n=1 Tax=Eimeria tenella TaxID=5802 RepID=U6KTQ2_EIMTE|nr:hypothetical protein, conserved [Eimeria tenella]CDJ40313.1 hypothetical protein, conserved [Eimeria tenella]|eukprot:XP_013231066.1 hypothetical protein, conserved [Eimeria tenella]
MLLLGCLSPLSPFLTLIALIPNPWDYPGCDLHATGPGGPLITWVGGEDLAGASSGFAEEEGSSSAAAAAAAAAEEEEETEELLLQKQKDCCRSYRRLLCVSEPRGCVLVKVLACSSGPYLLNLFEFRRLPNPDLFAVPRAAAAAAAAADAADAAGAADAADGPAAAALTQQQQAAAAAQQHAAAATAYVEAAAAKLPPAAGAAAAAGAANGNLNIHHNKTAELQHLLQPSLREATAAAAAAAGNGAAADALQQDQAFQRQLELIAADLKACALDNQQLLRMQQQLQQQQQQQQRSSIDNRPPWNDRFAVKGSENDHMYL